METFLNLLWLAITVAAVCLWRFRWSVPRRAFCHSLTLQAGAMICALALLFPVISLTDDLHPEIAVVDSVSGKRNTCLALMARPHGHGPSKGHVTFLLAALVPIGIACVSVSFSPLRTDAEFPWPADLFATRSLGRSPPANS